MGSRDFFSLHMYAVLDLNLYEFGVWSWRHHLLIDNSVLHRFLSINMNDACASYLALLDLTHVCLSVSAAGVFEQRLFGRREDFVQ